tara:strand:+ start:82039 stop:82563 length:525 start_codon:yes stop_codon:yes gene_type:complete
VALNQNISPFTIATFAQKCNFVTKFNIMIQRIQTVYILIASIVIGLLFALPFAEIAANDKFYLFNIQGILYDGEVVENGLPIMLFVGIILIIHIAAIFMYKKRIRQMRLLVFAILLMLGLFGMFYFFTFYSFKGFEVSFKIAVVFPLIAIILDYLAIRNIGKDEALIRSIDRIR